ncbi:hypothetical protein FQZ97_1041770 [compost metagenome]
MNTDRELLELAAKAVGYQTGHKWNRERLEMDPPVTAMVVHDAAGELVSTGWNPLDDDGQALRLAVKLSLMLDIYSGVVVGHDLKAALNITDAWYERDSGNSPGAAASMLHNGDPCGATRRAIVRAAAEIGRSMP